MASAPSLRELQRQMFALIRAPHLEETDIDDVVAGDDRLSGLGRVGIYNDMYFLRLLEVLRGAFPKVAQVMGDDAFAALAMDYVEAHPSRHPSLRFLGDRLAVFIREPDEARPHAGEISPWLADLAALEWQRYEVFDEADASTLTMAALRRFPPEAFADLPVRLIPGHRLVSASYAVERTWRALSKGDATEAPPAMPSTLLVWRQGTMVYHRSLEPPEAASLALAREGTAFGVICERLAASGRGDTSAEEVAAMAFRLLGRWTEDGLLTAE